MNTDNIDRYKRILQNALEVHQKRLEVRAHLAAIAQDITAYELGNRSFDREAVKDALLISGATIVKADHVKARLQYRDVKINLHQNPDDLWQALEHVLKDISNQSIMGE